MRALVKSFRPATLPQSSALVAFGAYAVRHATPNSAAFSQFLLASLATSTVCSTSMLRNDIRDFELGIDTIESKPNRPLVTGELSVESARAALAFMYVVLLFMLCLLNDAKTRLLLAATTIGTFFYTDFFKPALLFKNVVCAAIVAMAPMMGALSTTNRFPRFQDTVLIFFVVLHREILKDVADESGDAKAGIATAATEYGRAGALAIATAPLMAAGLLMRSGSALLAAYASLSLFFPAFAVHTTPLLFALLV